MRVGRNTHPASGSFCAAAGRRLDQTVLVGVRGGRRPGRQVQLGEDVAQVPGHRLLAEEQLGGDRRLAIPVATSRSTWISRPVRGPPSGGPRAGGRALHPRPVRERRRAAGTPTVPRPAPSPRRRRHRARDRPVPSGPGRAPPRTARRARARPSTPGAAPPGPPAASPSPRRTAPVACAATARSSGAPRSAAIRHSSSAPARAAARSPAASMISTWAGSSADPAHPVAGLVDDAANRGLARLRRRPGPAAATPARAAAPDPAGWPRGRAARPRRTRRAAGTARPAGRTPRPIRRVAGPA